MTTITALAGPGTIDVREPGVDPQDCPYGMGHAAGTAACGVFREQAQAKGFRSPRGGWACSSPLDPARLDSDLLDSDREGQPL